ncbi:hypothetical protein M569_13246, partial [Genlisea aurea]
KRERKKIKKNESERKRERGVERNEAWSDRSLRTRTSETRKSYEFPKKTRSMRK